MQLDSNTCNVVFFSHHPKITKIQFKTSTKCLILIQFHFIFNYCQFFVVLPSFRVYLIIFQYIPTCEWEGNFNLLLLFFSYDWKIIHSDKNADSLCIVIFWKYKKTPTEAMQIWQGKYKKKYTQYYDDDAIEETTTCCCDRQ